MFDAIFLKHWTTLQRLMWLKTNALARAVYEIVTGNPVTFTALRSAPLRQLKVAFSPVQDLHGYDSPWPAGGGKNKFNGTMTNNWTINGNGTDQAYANRSAVLEYIPVSEDTEYTFNYFGEYNNGVFFYDENKQGISYLAWDGRPRTFTTPTGTAYVRFSFYSASATTDKMQLELGPTATSYSPYSNECQITGWTGVNVWQAGVNLWNEDESNVQAITYTTTGGTVATKGGFVFNVPPGKYTAKAFARDPATTTGYIYGGVVDEDNKLTADQNLVTGAVWSTQTLVVGEGQKIIYVAAARSSSVADALVDIRKFNFLLEVGETVGDYVPYNPLSRSISISLGDTYYSGYVDVVTGVLTVDKRKIAITSADSIYAYSTNSSGNYRARYYNYGDWFKNHSDGLYSVGIVTTATNAYNWAAPNCFFTENTSVYVMPPSGITTEQAYKDWLDSLGGVEAVVELKESTTIQLTPTEVQSLLGENVMWSDANGDLTVEYRSN